MLTLCHSWEETAMLPMVTINRNNCGRTYIKPLSYPENALVALRKFRLIVFGKMEHQFVSDKNASKSCKSCYASGVKMYIDRSGYLLSKGTHYTVLLTIM
jgi:hypothetical protein